MQVTKEGIERIRAANDLAGLLAERGIGLSKKGRQLLALCPFHKEKTPSFSVSKERGLYRCFGCGASGDIIGFITKYDKVSFPAALESLARRAGLDLADLMEGRPRKLTAAPAEILTHPSSRPAGDENGQAPGAAGDVLARVVEQYHRTFCSRPDAQEYLRGRGLRDLDLLRAVKIGYADGSLLKAVPKDGPLRAQLVALGVITSEGRELLGGCLVVPIPDPLSGGWTSLYGRGLKTDRHCYLPGPLRGVLNFQAARCSSEVILTESILDALSFHQAGIATAIPIYGTNGFTPDHLDLMKRERVERVILALDSDDAGQKATDALKEKLTAAGLHVRSVSFPAGIKDANQLLMSSNGDASKAFRALVDAALPKPAPPPAVPASSSLLDHDLVSPDVKPAPVVRESDQLVIRCEDRTYRAKVYPASLGRLRATVKVEKGGAFHVDTLDLYASRSRAEFARRASKALVADVSAVESDLLVLLVDAERAADEKTTSDDPAAPPPMTEAERAEGLSFLKRADLHDQVAADIDALGYVGEDTNKRLLYLVAVSRKLPDPLSAVILSQSGAGKSGITEVIEQLTPPEDAVLITRLTPQSLYYTPPGFLDRKLVIIEERHGSMEADYSIRVLQSRKKLIAAAPVKDPATGSMRTKVFTVEARAAFIEATTASAVNHENATRCFELTMDESVEQTQRIHERQRIARTEHGLALKAQTAGVVRRHWSAQRLLEPLPVVIPYADALTFPSAWMRTRRDHARFLNLIEVSAFLHQHQREQRGGAIVASLDDYATAYALAGHVLAETLSDVKKPLRDAYTRIRELCQGSEGTVSRREIREALSLPDSTVRRWLQDLVDLEYLAVAEGGQGKTARYRFLDQEPRPRELAGLLAPPELRRKVEGTSPLRHTPPNGSGGVNPRP